MDQSWLTPLLLEKLDRNLGQRKSGISKLPIFFQRFCRTGGFRPTKIGGKSSPANGTSSNTGGSSNFKLNTRIRQPIRGWSCKYCPHPKCPSGSGIEKQSPGSNRILSGLRPPDGAWSPIGSVM